VTALIIARLTWREAARRRLVAALVILTLVVVVLSGWAFHLLAVNTPATLRFAGGVIRFESQFLILVAFMFSWVLALGSVFIGAPAIASDIDAGIVLAVLPRPIRRSDFYLGKWIGLGSLIACYTVASGALEIEAVNLATGYLPPRPLLTMLFLSGEGLVMLTLALLLSTRLAPMTTGIIGVVLFGLAWMGGIAGAIGTVLDSRTLVRMATISKLALPTDGLWQGAVYSLEPEPVLQLGRAAAQLVAGNPFFSGSPPPLPYLLWVAAWLLGMLGLGVLSLARRDL